MLQDSFDEAGQTSCKTYAKVLNELAGEWRVKAPSPFSSGSRIEQVHDLVRRIVREQSRRAVEEEAFRIYRHVTQHLPDCVEDAFRIPATNIYINSSDVGYVKLREFWIRPADFDGNEDATAA